MDALAPRSQTIAHRMSRTVLEPALIVGTLMIFGTAHVFGCRYIERAYGPPSSFEVQSHMVSAD
jgi:hypothetical protein